MVGLICYGIKRFGINIAISGTMVKTNKPIISSTTKGIIDFINEVNDTSQILEET